jgi:glycosyltransferase involved in cell wall biosynthesis
MLKSLEKKSIALCVIAKNEVYALQRCILSAKPLVDFVLVVDTGSTDGTQKKARELMHSISIPGEVIEEPWQNFAYNRTYALAQLRARTSIDYGLMLDADQVLMYSPNFSPSSFKAGLAADAYDVCIKLGGIEYFQPQLTSNRLNIVYKGVLHEYREIPANAYRDRVEGFVIEEVRDGSRSKNPKKYQDDAALLQEAMAVESDPFLLSRYKFYLAQSYRDSGDDYRALEFYLERSTLGYWIEEVFLSLYYAAQIKERLRFPDSEIVQSYLSAHEAFPHRIEALHGAVRFLRLRDKFQLAYHIAERGIKISAPSSGLFLERWIYDYGMLDEFAISAYWSGHPLDCWDACIKILQESDLPENDRDRIRRNATFAAQQLARSEEEIRV